MKGIATFLASAAIATALGVSGAAAQQPGGAANAQSNMRWNSTNVDPATPFGDIDITAAGRTASDVRTYLADLSGEEVIELIGRCSVISPTTLASFGGNRNQGLGVNADGNQNNAAGGANVAGAAGGQSAAGGAAGNIGVGAAGAGAGVGVNAGVGGAQANLGGAAGGQAGAGGAGAGAAGGAGAQAGGQVAANQAGAPGGNAMGDANAMGRANAAGYQQNATTFCTNLASAIFGNDAQNR